MRRLLQAFIILCLLTQGGLCQKQDGSGLAQNKESGNSQPIPAPQENRKTNPEQECPRCELPPWWKTPEGWLAVLGIPTLLLLYWQARKTHHSADAASANALALVNSQRAWVMAEAKFEPAPATGIYRTDSTDPSGQTTTQTHARVELSILNTGPTPAWVFQQYVQLKVTPEIIMSLNHYPSPHFPFMGEGKVAHVNYGIYPIAKEQPAVTWWADVWDDGFPTPENGLNVYIFGVVRYRDAFSSLRETYFGYRVRDHKHLERIPNEAYNKHT